MKVFCINEEGWYETIWKPVTISYFFGLKKVTEQKRYDNDTEGPTYGDVCTVIGEEIGDDGLKYYFLKEWPGEDNSYEQSCFVPISEQEIEIFNESLNERGALRENEV